MEKLHGIVTALVTPIDKQGNILSHSVEQLVERLIRAGIHGIYPLGSTGEMLLLSKEQRMRMAECVINCVRGRVPVYVHIAAPTTKETVFFARHAYDAGATGIAAVTPMYYKVSDAEMLTYYGEIARSIPEDFPLYLYNLPQSTGNDLKPRVCAQLAQRYPNIIGIKYSFADMERTREYLQIKNGGFSVLHGSDTLLDAALILGCDGVVSGLSNAFPLSFVKVYEAFARGDSQSVRAGMEDVVKIMKGDKYTNFTESEKRFFTPVYMQPTRKSPEVCYPTISSTEDTGTSISKQRFDHELYVIYNNSTTYDKELVSDAQYILETQLNI